MVDLGKQVAHAADALDGVPRFFKSGNDALNGFRPVKLGGDIRRVALLGLPVGFKIVCQPYYFSHLFFLSANFHLVCAFFASKSFLRIINELKKKGTSLDRLPIKFQNLIQFKLSSGSVSETPN